VIETGAVDITIGGELAAGAVELTTGGELAAGAGAVQLAASREDISASSAGVNPPGHWELAHAMRALALAQRH